MVNTCSTEKQLYNFGKMKPKKFKKKGKKTLLLKTELNLEKAMGAAYREQYLEDNPHGYRQTKKVHKNKKKYNRKGKNAKKWLKDAKGSSTTFFVSIRQLSYA